MIVKHRDASPELIEALANQARHATDKVRQYACRSAVSRLQADQTTACATDLIDVQVAHSDDWAVIHDLRLQVAGHAIQIHHLLISSTLNFFCLDTRFLEYGIDLNDNGECHAFDRLERKAIASPLNKAARDARKLTELVQCEGMLPKNFRFTRKASVQAYVVTNPALRLGLSGKIENPAIGIHTSSALFPLLWSRGFSNAGFLGRRLNADALFDIGSSLAALHRPTYSPSLLQSESLAAA